ncbi:hypothetical protein YC2023_015336 [Brassica napus]
MFCYTTGKRRSPYAPRRKAHSGDSSIAMHIPGEGGAFKGDAKARVGDPMLTDTKPVSSGLQGERLDAPWHKAQGTYFIAMERHTPF